MISRIKKYINKSDFIKNSLTLFTGTSVAQLIPILISPILTRIYSPGDFGVLALYMSIAGVLSVFATGRYELAIMLPKKNEDAINVFSLSIVISILISILIFFMIVFFNEHITRLSGNNKISVWLYFLPLSILSIGFFKSLNYWFNRKNKFKNIAVSKVTATSTNAFLNLLIGFLKKGPQGLIVGWISGQLVSMIYLFRLFFKHDRKYLNHIKKVKIIALAKRYKKFPLFDTWSEFLNVLSVQIPVILIIHFFGEDITGHYSFTFKILLVPFSLLAFSMGQAFFKKATELKISNGDIGNFSFNVFKKLVLISFIPLSIIGIFGDYLFPFIFGKEWVIAGKYSGIISLWVFTIFLSSPLVSVFAIFEKQKVNFIFNFITFILRTSILVVVSIQTKDHFSVIFWYAISGFVLRFIYLLIIMKIADFKLYKIFYEILKYILPLLAFLVIIRKFLF